MSLWALLAAPLLAGNDLSKMNQETLDILTNKEVIAVDQDAKGVQGRRVAQEGPLEVWAKPLADGSVAVGLFNRGESANPVTVNFKDVGGSVQGVFARSLAAQRLGTVHWKLHGRCSEARGDSAQDSVRRE
jgi:alpha-galactosidase